MYKATPFAIYCAFSFDDIELAALPGFCHRLYCACVRTRHHSDSEQQMFLHSIQSREKPYAPITTGVSAPVEALPAVACSLVASYYAIQREAARSLPPSELGTSSGTSSLLLPNISHGLLLMSYLVFGCCVSSYKHRMRGRDPCQGAVFLGWVVWLGLVGRGVGWKADTILLGMIPWALVVAMLSSYFGHASARWLVSRRKNYGMNLD
ncbi:hypothetical protein GGR55DRAFT_34836 [Xylaria sp. FL0064]|nr:hypothetical protein GGR55DRAFT_34836 [Xylaria sp. FL0064]